MSGQAQVAGAGRLTDRQIAAATLASLPHITPARLRRLLVAFESAEAALGAVQRGRAAFVIRGSRTQADAVARAWADRADPARVRRRLEARGTHVWIAGDDEYPIPDEIPGRPAVLFGEGAAVDALRAPRVAIVGTRSASPQGLADAQEIAKVLSGAGVTVVSGLAIGIDAAAHTGALAAAGSVVGVVATGLDVTYPRRHERLHARVREQGVLVSEHAYGVQPHRSQFPVRNRIIAAMCDACVVVEAKASGGAGITAAYANEYGRTVFAVPGSRRNEAAAGCNALIKDGAQVLLDPGDVLIELGNGRAGMTWQAPPAAPDHPDDAAILATLAGEPASVDQLVGRTHLDSDRVAGAVRRLEQSGRVVRHRGRWWPR